MSRDRNAKPSLGFALPYSKGKRETSLRFHGCFFGLLALAGCAPAAIRINGCAPRALPPTPDVVSVPAKDCRYALCLDGANLAALRHKLTILEDAAQR